MSLTKPSGGDPFNSGATKSTTVVGAIVDWVNQQHVNVKEATYGATGDGSTDDTSKIQAAIDAVGAAGGGSVFFPPGTYKISSALTCSVEGVRLVGSMLQASIIQLSADAVGIAVTANRVNIEYLEFLPPSGGTTNACVTITGVSNWRLSDLYFYKNGSGKFDTAIKGTGALTGLLERVTVDSTTTYGIWLEKQASPAISPNAITIVNPNMANCGTAGIFWENGHSGLILGGTVQGTGTYGIWLRSNGDSGTANDIAIVGMHYEVTGTQLYLDHTRNITSIGGKWEAGTANLSIDTAVMSWIHGIHVQTLPVTITGATSTTTFVGGDITFSQITDGANAGNTAYIDVYDRTNTRKVTKTNRANLGGGNGDMTKTCFGTKTWDPPSVNAGASTQTTVTVTGAAVGDMVLVSLSTLVGNAMTLTGSVDSGGSVTVTLENVSAGAIDLGSGTLSALTIRGAAD